jgi:hypothetical protein
MTVFPSSSPGKWWHHLKTAHNLNTFCRGIFHKIKTVMEDCLIFWEMLPTLMWEFLLSCGELMACKINKFMLMLGE